MTEKKKIKLALRLYPFYEAVSGDLLFFSVIQTLFFSRVKGFSAADIALGNISRIFRPIQIPMVRRKGCASDRALMERG